MTDDEFHTDVHVMPENDLREHEQTRTCWCQPQLTQEPGADVVVIHHSADGRELVEEHGLQ